MFSATAPTIEEYRLLGTDVCRRLGISREALPRVVRRCAIRTWSVPGAHRRYHAGDVERVASEAAQGPGVAASA